MGLLKTPKMMNSYSPVKPTKSPSSRWTPGTKAAWLIPVLCCLGTLFVLLGQTPQVEEGGPVASGQAAYVRVWAVLGELSSPDTYSLSWEATRKLDGKKDGKLFSSLKGCWRSGFSAGYFKIPSGKCRFLLTRDGASAVTAAELEDNFVEDGASTLLVVMENGAPVMKLVPELPAAPEQDGVYIYNLLAETPLKLQIGERPAVVIPFTSVTPSFIPPSELAGQPLKFTFPSKRKNEISKEVEYQGRGRLSAVYMRSEHSLPGVFVYPAEPERE